MSVYPSSESGENVVQEKLTIAKGKKFSDLRRQASHPYVCE